MKKCPKCKQKNLEIYCDDQYPEEGCTNLWYVQCNTQTCLFEAGAYKTKKIAERYWGKYKED